MPFTQSHGLPLLILGSGIALAATLTLAGCAETPDVEPSPSNSSSSSSTTVESTETSSATETLTPEPAPKLTPPVKPEAMKHNNEEGAIAFANYFLEVLEYSAASGNAHLLNDLSSDACRFCNTFIGLIDSANENNQRMTGLELSSTGGFEMSVVSESVYGMSSTVDFSAYELFTSSNTSAKRFEAVTLKVGFVAQYREGSWVAEEFGEES